MWEQVGKRALHDAVLTVKYHGEAPVRKFGKHLTANATGRFL